MKIAKRLLAIVAALAIVCAFAGCNKNDSDGANSSASAVSEQPSKTDPLVGQWQSETLPEYIYTFNDDKTGQYDMAGKILEMTYSTENGKITLNFLTEGYSAVTLDYELDGDRLNIKDSYGKDTFYIKVVK